MNDDEPSDWQALITGQWYGTPRGVRRHLCGLQHRTSNRLDWGVVVKVPTNAAKA